MEIIPKMVSLAMDAPVVTDMPQAVNLSIAPQYPYGLCICLDDFVLGKLGLDDECDVGDTVHFHAMAKVTSKSKTEQSGTRIELQITDMSAEDEDEENEENEEDEESGEDVPAHKVKNPYKK